MRIRQLHLIRYGHFTDASMTLPDAGATLMLGDNEAGKSTTKSAIEDLLFGILNNSPHNFLHDYGAMRIGATLEKGAQVLKVRRRKGNKDTLLSDHDLPIVSGEGALAPFLAGADRSFYARMFSLDHHRLRQGGQEILAAQDDVGQTLFSASAGILGLRASLKAMEDEADSLWAPRRAAHRRYFQAEDKLKSADASMRDHIVTTAKWQLVKTALEAANDACIAVEQEIQTKTAEQRRLSRIRRVCRDIRKRVEVQDAIQSLGQIPSFSEEASQILEKAAKDDTDAAARIETLTEQLGTLQKERAALAYDQALLLRAADIKLLHERRIQIRGGKTDLPKRRAELAVAENQLKRLAAELEWDTVQTAQVIARLPSRAKIANARTLLNRRGELHAAKDIALASMGEADDKHTDLTAQINALGPAIDSSRLSAVLKAIREKGDLAPRLTNAERDQADVLSAIKRGLAALHPAVPDQETLASMPVPPLDSVQSHRDSLHKLDHRLQACRERMRAVEQELGRHRKAYDRIASEERVVAPDELERLRQQRNTGWSIIRRRYVEGGAVADDEVLAFSAPDALPQAFEAAMSEADDAADHRFEKHAAAARMIEIARQIGEQEDLLDSLRTEEQTLAAEQDALTIAWKAMWNAVPVILDNPDVMIDWLRARADILDRLPQLAAAERQISDLRAQDSEGKNLIQAEFDALGVASTSIAGQPLPVAIEAAAALERKFADDVRSRHDLEAALRKAATDAARKRKALEKADAEWADWAVQWQVALVTLQLPPLVSPETADVQINAIDEMREAANRINELQHERIEKIERDIKSFEHDVAALVQAIAPQLATVEPEDAVLQLERIVDEDIKVRDQVAAKDKTRAALQKRIDECLESCRDAREIIRRFQEQAGVATIGEIRLAIEQSDRLRGLQAEFETLTNALARDGDGLSVAALNEECAGINVDEIASREERITQELQDLRDRHMEARENRNNARREFDAIGGDDRAARDAADRQAALAETRDIAERYVRLRSSVLLLQWAIDRYRREKQAPMLKRAGELFAILTGGSFEALQPEFESDDTVHLVGVRSDGRRVRLAGMSTGTADQLYLALRVAAVENYLEHAAPMPFIADDLFINFDNKRAAAGFRVLNELAKKTQVLFFTHHQHLVDVARTTLGPLVPTVVLPAVTGQVSTTAQTRAA
jgi:uncharacterized protein YhaN